MNLKKPITITLGIFLLLFNMAAHEFGHALAMKRQKVDLEEISVLGFGPKLFTFYWPALFENTPLNVRLIPLGAYVSPAKTGIAQIKQMSHAEYIQISTAGILMNFFLGSVLLLLASVLQRKLSWFRIGLIAAGFLVIFPVVASYCYLFAGFVLAVYLGIKIRKDFGLLEKSGSILSIGKEIAQTGGSFKNMVFLSASIAIAIGILNALPFLPLDGGNTVLHALNGFASSENNPLVYQGFRIVLTYPFVVIMYYALKSDFLMVIGKKK